MRVSSDNLRQKKRAPKSCLWVVAGAKPPGPYRTLGQTQQVSAIETPVMYCEEVLGMEANLSSRRRKKLIHCDQGICILVKEVHCDEAEDKEGVEKQTDD